MSNEEIKNIIKVAIEEYDKTQKRKKMEETYHNTVLLMENYNAIRDHVYNLDAEIEDLRGLNIDKQDTWLYTVSRSKAQSLKMISYVKEAMNIVSRRFKRKDEYYKYRAFELRYLQEKTNEDIMSELSCSKNRPTIWIKEVTEEVSKTLWGIDAI